MVIGLPYTLIGCLRPIECFLEYFLEFHSFCVSVSLIFFMSMLLCYVMWNRNWSVFAPIIEILEFQLGDYLYVPYHLLTENLEIIDPGIIPGFLCMIMIPRLVPFHV